MDSPDPPNKEVEVDFVKECQINPWVFSQACIDSRPDEGHQGMANLFLLRYDDTGAPIVRGCHPFCSGYPRFAMHLADCYQERVWNGIQTLRAEICQHLGRYSEKQGMFARDSSNIVMGKVRDFVRPPTTRLARSTKRVLNPGMVLS